MRKFFIQNFGCRATQADGAALVGLLERQGLIPAGTHGQADLVILNTCTVTASADEDVRKSIHRVHRENPQANILVTGCYAQRSPEELARMPGVTWVVGNSHKILIPELISAAPDAPYHGQIHVGDIQAASEFLSAPIDEALADRSRPNLKIQDGCNNLCTFCIIPSVRGHSRSMSLDRVVAEVRCLGAAYREVVLTGINLGRWGRDSLVRHALPKAANPPGPVGRTPWSARDALVPLLASDIGIERERLRLADLLRTLVRETPIERLRLSSVEPMDFSNDLLDLMASEPRIAQHVHAPLQSGSDAVLKRMKRRYRVRHYEDRIAHAYALMPMAAYGADVMTGFPGESDAEFEETCALIERLPFTYLHVFTYSERPGTPAASATHVPQAVRKERTRRLRALGERKSRAFREKLVGRRLSAVTLSNGAALTGNYVTVELAVPRPANCLVELEIGAVTAKGVREATPFQIQS